MGAAKTQDEKAAEERWQDFAYEYIDSGWFDDDRTKTLCAMHALCGWMQKEEGRNPVTRRANRNRNWRVTRLRPSLMKAAGSASA